ncbi:hypothetical protein [Paraburkholderia aspalathi]|uniref:Uncharacterized protein n=1 Tax=Paraburkholderia aspalathi TaxID=1324617 RepID=A0A1I7ERN5_9BURK|nr:hypothetical protein [Paraburkholderia aspalathi]SFU26589.1 hypothetical protein SAMN05192563_10605 [Paraburkholderia aspalathi]
MVITVCDGLTKYASINDEAIEDDGTMCIEAVWDIQTDTSRLAMLDPSRLTARLIAANLAAMSGKGTTPTSGAG